MSKLKEYAAFVGIVENGSITAAAKATLSSPSSVSKSLAKLEARIGTRLIDRSTHSISITQSGKTFYLKAKEILEKVQLAEDMLTEEENILAGKLSLSIPPVLLRTSIIDLFKEFSLQFQTSTFHLDVSDNYTDLEENNVDFAIRIGDLEDSRLTAVTLGKLQMSCFATPEYIKKSGQLRYSTLVEKNQLIIPTSLSFPAIAKITGKSRKQEINMTSLNTASDANTVIEMGCAGFGVFQALDITVSNELDSGRIIRIFTSQKKVFIPVHLVFRKHAFMQKHKVVFKEFIKENFNRIQS